MAAGRRLRENSHLQGEQAQGWTGWKKAMVPPILDLKPRGPENDQVGFMCPSINEALADKARCCGIYEWQARKEHEPHRVVYVGSTCREGDSLRSRIREYCQTGSHKADLINDALGRGYELWVRVKTSGGRAPRPNAIHMENALLARYDYAWNRINNEVIRDILP